MHGCQCSNSSANKCYISQGLTYGTSRAGSRLACASCRSPKSCVQGLAPLLISGRACAQGSRGDENGAACIFVAFQSNKMCHPAVPTAPAPKSIARTSSAPLSASRRTSSMTAPQRWESPVYELRRPSCDLPQLTHALSVWDDSCPFCPEARDTWVHGKAYAMYLLARLLKRWPRRRRRQRGRCCLQDSRISSGLNRYEEGLNERACLHVSTKSVHHSNRRVGQIHTQDVWLGVVSCHARRREGLINK